MQQIQKGTGLLSLFSCNRSELSTCGERSFETSPAYWILCESMKFTSGLWRAALRPLTYSLLELHQKKKKEEEENMGCSAFWDMLTHEGSGAAFQIFKLE